MGIIITIAIIIIVFIFYKVLYWKEYKDYKKIQPRMKARQDKIIEEGKELKRKAEEKMKKEKCSKGGKCNFVLKNKTSEYIYPYDDQITGHYKCTKCGKTRSEIIQYPN